MSRIFLVSCMTAALTLGLLVAGAEAATWQFRALDKSAQASSNLLEPARFAGGHFRRGHHFQGFRHHRFHHPRFSFFVGAPLYYSSPDCWWNRRYHRWVCPSY